VEGRGRVGRKKEGEGCDRGVNRRDHRRPDKRASRPELKFPCFLYLWTAGEEQEPSIGGLAAAGGGKGRGFDKITTNMEKGEAP
jgi:hypothetical protein